MALKEKTIKFSDNGKDHEFLIRQMSAVQAQSFIIRAVFILSESGLIDDVNQADGLESAVELLRHNGLKILRGLDYEKVQPLLEELLGCCSQVVNNGPSAYENKLTMSQVDAIGITEVKHLFLLQKEAAVLSFGFFGGAGGEPSNSPAPYSMGKPPRAED